MTSQSLILLGVFLLVLLALAYPLGILLARVGDGSAVPGLGWLAKIETLLYRMAGVKAVQGQDWKSYALALVAFNTIGALFVYGVQRMQLWLPLGHPGRRPWRPRCSWPRPRRAWLCQARVS